MYISPDRGDRRDAPNAGKTAFFGKEPKTSDPLQRSGWLGAGSFLGAHNDSSRLRKLSAFKLPKIGAVRRQSKRRASLARGASLV
jgi:hypothetical protein